MLVLIESGFANLNIVPSGYYRSLHLVELSYHKSHGTLPCHPAFVGLFHFSQCTQSMARSKQAICPLQLALNDDQYFDSSSPHHKSPLNARNGLSLDWVSESIKRPAASFPSRPAPKHTSQRPGFEVPASWRDGVDYELGASHTFSRGETVAVLFSDGTLRFGRIERTPHGSDHNGEYTVQVIGPSVHSKATKPFGSAFSRSFDMIACRN